MTAAHLRFAGLILAAIASSWMIYAPPLVRLYPNMG